MECLNKHRRTQKFRKTSQSMRWFHLTCHVSIFDVDKADKVINAEKLNRIGACVILIVIHFLKKYNSVMFRACNETRCMWYANIIEKSPYRCVVNTYTLYISSVSLLWKICVKISKLRVFCIHKKKAKWPIQWLVECDLQWYQWYQPTFSRLFVHFSYISTFIER